jgi:hypothetical protein
MQRRSVRRRGLTGGAVSACKGFGSTRFRSRPTPGISEWIESGRPGAEEGQKGRDPIDPGDPRVDPPTRLVALTAAAAAATPSSPTRSASLQCSSYLHAVVQQPHSVDSSTPRHGAASSSLQRSSSLPVVAVAVESLGTFGFQR